MKKHLKKLIAIITTTTILATAIVGCGTKDAGDTSSENVTLTYSIWDKNQQAGMEAMAEAFHKENPNITVKVEVTPWEQYWTKLDAGATSGSLPDVFWMHSNNFLKYANGGILIDTTDTIKNSKITDMNNFPKELSELYTLDGKIYSIPKDYSTIGLWYNKTMFDEKGIAYPDATWDWDKLLEAAKQLTDSDKKIYGMLAPSDDEQGYYNYVYQNNGYILSPDKTKSGFDLAETREAIQWDLDLSTKHKVSPTQEQFADTSFAQYFESGKAAMGLFGSWMTSEFNSNEYVAKNCDVAVLPQGKTKATIYNGLANSGSAKTKYPEQTLKFLEYLGSKEANTIQGESGAAIPAYKGVENSWVDHYKTFKLGAYTEMLEYAVIFPNSATKAKWYQIQNETMTKVWSGQITLEEGCDKIAKEMNELLATE